MEIEINEIVSRVNVVDGDTLVTPQTMRRIVASVLEAVQEAQKHDQRARAERRVTSGVSAEQHEEGR